MAWMTFSLHQGGTYRAMSSQITHTVTLIHPLAHLRGTCALCSLVEPFLYFLPQSLPNGLPRPRPEINR